MSSIENDKPIDILIKDVEFSPEGTKKIIDESLL